MRDEPSDPRDQPVAAGGEPSQLLSRRSLLAGGVLAVAGAMPPGRLLAAGPAPARRGGRTARAGAASPRVATAASPRPAPGLLRVATMVTTASLDPLRGDGGSAASAVFDALTAISPGNHDVVAGLAASWRSVSPTVTALRIDPQAVFSDGSPVQATDAAFSLRTALENGSPLSTLLAGILSVDVGAPSELRVRTASPDPLLLRRLAAVPVVSQAAYTSVGVGDAPQLIGSGYYEMGSFTPNSSYVLYANSRSWKGPPATAAIRVGEPVTEDQLLSALSEGECDVAVDLPTAALTSLAGRFTLQLSSPGNVSYLVLDSSTGPFADRRVRLAANLAVDAGRLVTAVLGGAGAVLSGQLAVPGCVGYDASLQAIPPDPARARRLLAAAGLPHGFDTVLAGPAEATDLLAAIAGQLAAVGIRARLAVIDLTAWLAALESGAPFPMLLASIDLAPLFDIGPGYRLLTGAGNRAEPSFSDGGLKRLDTEQSVELDPKRRQALLAQMAAVVHTELPLVPLFEQQWIYGRQPLVHGLTTLGPTLLFADLELAAS